jgi:Zn-dependent peptidase ImmA (M78 family)
MATAAPVPAGDRAAVDKARIEARKLAGLYSSPPIPVNEIARKVGVRVMLRPFPPDHARVSALCDFDKGVIHVNAMEEPERQHYAIAHELGHFVLHRNKLRSNPDLYTVLPRFGTPPPSLFETSAEAFAAELLIPRKLLDPVSKTAPPFELARVFKVPVDVMERRLKNG